MADNEVDTFLNILLAPIMLPVKAMTLPFQGFAWLADKINEQVQGELTDKGKIQEELLELQMLYEMEEIKEEEYDRKETELMERLNAIKESEEE